MQFRSIALAALALALVLPAAPVAAEDDLVRQLVNACVGCRFPKDLRGRELRLHPPALSADVERAMRNAERALRDVEREMRLRPPITPELRQRLREIESRQFMVPPLPAIPPVPATAPIPTVPSTPSVNPGTPPAAPAPPAQRR